MATRRDFFKQFVGQLGALHDDLKGVESIPLNRLNELPEEIIEQITPMFFQDEEWQLNNGCISIHSSKKKELETIQLDEIELEALKLFENDITLKHVALVICNKTKTPFGDIYRVVTSLFFKLASLRICHPLEVYNIDELVKTKKETNE